MEAEGQSLAALSHFLKASSKAALDRCINVAFASRFEPPAVSAPVSSPLFDVNRPARTDLHPCPLHRSAPSCSRRALAFLRTRPRRSASVRLAEDLLALHRVHPFVGYLHAGCVGAAGCDPKQLVRQRPERARRDAERCAGHHRRAARQPPQAGTQRVKRAENLLVNADGMALRR